MASRKLAHSRLQIIFSQGIILRVLLEPFFFMSRSQSQLWCQFWQLFFALRLCIYNWTTTSAGGKACTRLHQWRLATMPTYEGSNQADQSTLHWGSWVFYFFSLPVCNPLWWIWKSSTLGIQGRGAKHGWSEVDALATGWSAILLHARSEGLSGAALSMPSFSLELPTTFP